MNASALTFRITLRNARGRSEEQLLAALLSATVRRLGPEAIGHAKGLIAGPGGRFWASTTDVKAPVGSGRLEEAPEAEDVAAEAGSARGRRGVEARVSLLFLGVPPEELRAALDAAAAELARAQDLKISVRPLEEADGKP